MELLLLNTPSQFNKFANHLDSLEQDVAYLKGKINAPFLKDYMKFQAMLDHEQSKAEDNKTVLIQDPEQLIEQELFNSDDDEQSKSPDTLSVVQNISSPSSKRTSLFTLSFLGKKNSFLDQGYKKHGSFMSEEHLGGHSNRRFSLLDFSAVNFQKRNSDFVSCLPSSILMGKYSTRKSMFETIKRASLKIDFEAGILSNLEGFKNPSSNDSPIPLNKSSGQPQTMEGSPVKKSSFFLQNLAGGNLMYPEDIQSETESDSDENEDPEGTFNVSRENFLLLTMVKYGRIKFRANELRPEMKESELKKINLLDFYDDDGSYIDPTDENNLFSGLLDENENILRRWAVRSDGIIPYQPFYVVSKEGLLKSRFRKDERNLIFEKMEDRSKHSFEDKRIEIEFYDFMELEPSYLETRYAFFIAENGGKEAFSITLYHQNLFCHMIPFQALGSCKFEKHFSVKYDVAGTRFPVNMFPLICMQYPCKGRDYVLPRKILENIASYLREDEIYIKDDNSKKGTFVKLDVGNPILLQEGSLFMLSNYIGFYVKGVSSDKIENEFEIEQLENALEIISVSTMTLPNSFVTGQKRDMDIEESKESSDDNSNPKKRLPRKFYESLLKKETIPRLEIEIVKWNNRFEYYEEKGGIYIICSNGHTDHHSINLFEKSSCMGKISAMLGLQYNLMINFNSQEKLWTCDTARKSYSYNYLSETCYTNSGYLFDSESIFSGRNMNGNIRKGINLSPYSEPLEEGLWYCISHFDILQEKFTGGWVRVRPGTYIKFGSIVVQANLKSLYSL